MEELKKIDLSSKKEELKTFKTNKKTKSIFSSKLFKLLSVIVVVFVIIGVVSYFTIVVPAQKAYKSALVTYQQAKIAMDAAKKQNIELASQELIKTKESLLVTQKDLKSFSYVKSIPFAGEYYKDAERLMNAAFYGLDSTSILLDSLKPYADVLGLKGKGSFVMGSAEQRIQTAVLTMGKITPQIDKIADSLEKAKKEIDEVDPNRYPSFIVGDKVNKQLSQLRTLTDQGVAMVNEARPLIKILPSLLGESKEKKYLVLFQNDKEMRPTGGFITAYAIFSIDKGVIRVDKSDDIYNLDKSLTVRSKPPKQIQMYLPNVTTFNLRDSNISPDFIESMNTFESLYKNASSKINIDGIIALDTHVLVSTIKILNDEVWAGGVEFTTKNDKRCNCPQVIYELERIADTPKSLDLRVTSLESVQAQRKDILGVLLYSVMQKALKSSPKLYWGPLFQMMVDEANQKHVMVYLHDKDAQKGVEVLNLAGRIKTFDGDYIHINNANLGGAKANMFVKESVTQEIKVGGDGAVTKTVTIQYKNPFPPSDCNLERGGLCLNAVLRNWLRIYVPKGSTLVDSKGSEVKLSTYEELGKTVFDGFLTVKPQGAATFTITYRLPFKVKKGSNLPLLIQKQPGTDNNNYVVKLNGREVEKFELLTDKELHLKP